MPLTTAFFKILKSLKRKQKLSVKNVDVKNKKKTSEFISLTANVLASPLNNGMLLWQFKGENANASHGYSVISQS